jgi:hypothetical protein
MDAFFLLHTPARVGVCGTFRVSVPVNQKARSITHLRNCRTRAKIPNCRRKHVFTLVEKGSEVVRFVSPVRQVGSTRPATCGLLIYVKGKLVIGAHIYIKMLRTLG